MASRSTLSSSTESSSNSASGRLEVGYVGKAHGLRGDTTVRLTTDRVERVAPGAVLYAGDRELSVVASRPHQKRHIVTFAGVTTREGAEELRGSTLQADPIEDDDALWVHDLIGQRIVEIDGTDRGIVEALEQNPASDLLVTDSGALIPLTFLVERRDGVLVIDPPNGLFDYADS